VGKMIGIRMIVSGCSLDSIIVSYLNGDIRPWHYHFSDVLLWYVTANEMDPRRESDRRKIQGSCV